MLFEQMRLYLVDGELAVEEARACETTWPRAGAAGNCWTHYALRTVFSAKACKSFRKKQPARRASSVHGGPGHGATWRSWARCWR